MADELKTELLVHNVFFCIKLVQIVELDQDDKFENTHTCSRLVFRYVP